MKFFKKFSAVIVAGVMSMSLFAGSASANTVGTPEQELRKNLINAATVFDLHNAARKEAGVSPLVISTDLSLGLSQVFTNKLASSGENRIWHNSGAELGKWGSRVGENVAMFNPGGDGALVHGRWMNSPGHKRNILNPDYTIMSIGYAANIHGNFFSTVNFYASSKKSGKTYRTGAEWVASFEEGSNNTKPSEVNVYLTEGEHFVNGRHWSTKCEPYSQTQRCRTEIWATQIIETGGSFMQRSGWVFNNLTYAASDRGLWKGNPLAANGVRSGAVAWKASDGRMWRTECDTATTGRNGCRSYSKATIVSMKNGTYVKTNDYVFNNIVLFK